MENLRGTAVAAMDELLRAGGALDTVASGDVVRLERSVDGTWLYCNVDQVLEDGTLECFVLDAQSWPNLVTDGVIPGRRYRVPSRCVLSIVRHSKDLA